MKNRYYGRTYREVLIDGLEILWRCDILRQHREKMDSHGRCYRCGRQLR